MTGRVGVLVIGGGQAGLTMGYELARRGVDFLILDASRRVGDAWRARWTSLTLFTPAEYSALPGTPFPAARSHHPLGKEVADYLEAYASAHRLPVRSGERVKRLARVADGFAAELEDGVVHARQVVVATGPFQTPVRPTFAARLDSSVKQLHSADYRGPADVPDGPSIVVGGGNSGLQIAAELSQTRLTTLSIGTLGAVLPSVLLGRSVFWWLERSGGMRVPVTSRLGRRASRRQIIIGAGPKAVARSCGVRLADRAVDATGGGLITASGSRLRAASVVWATGFAPDFSWIQLPVLDATGTPEQERGVTAVPGLYFLGLSWMHTRGSALIGWVGRDAEYLARRITTFSTEV